MIKTFRIKKPNITYRQFCLIQNIWVELLTTDNEEKIISKMHPKLHSKLERIVTKKDGTKDVTTLWISEDI